MKLGEKLHKNLVDRKLDICSEYGEKIKNSKTYAPLVAMFFKGSDWSLANDFPDENLSREHRKGLAPFGVFVDAKVARENLMYSAYLGKSNSKAIFTKYSVAQVIARHSANVDIVATDNTVVYLSILDKATVNITTKEKAIVTVFKYGKEAKVTATGNVVIVDK